MLMMMMLLLPAARSRGRVLVGLASERNVSGIGQVRVLRYEFSVPAMQ